MHELYRMSAGEQTCRCVRVFIFMCVFRQFICNPNCPDLFVFMQQLWTQQVDIKKNKTLSPPLCFSLSLWSTRLCVVFMYERGWVCWDECGRWRGWFTHPPPIQSKCEEGLQWERRRTPVPWGSEKQRYVTWPEAGLQHDGAEKESHTDSSESSKTSLPHTRTNVRIRMLFLSLSLPLHFKRSPRLFDCITTNKWRSVAISNHAQIIRNTESGWIE